MKRLRFSVAVLAAGFAMSANAQNDLGAACGCPTVATRPTSNLSLKADVDGNLTAANTVLSCDTVYIINDKIYVGDGKSLTINPGTVIKGAVVPGPAGDAHALIVSKGAKIFAPGTCDCPIVFTAGQDPMDGTYGITNRGKWGGVVLLGKARNNLKGGFGANTVSDGIGFIEGFLVAEPRNLYGAGPGLHDDNDNSGIMTYVSIRHAGDVVGASNELNGLTLGSVGRGTTLSNIEVISNFDDGIEFFGGSVDLKYASVLFNNDDGFDWDQGWSGSGQFWLVVKSDLTTYTGGDNGFELDGDDALQCTYQANPKIYNCTFIGAAGVNGGPAVDNNQAIEWKEASRGEIRNCVFANYNRGAAFATTLTHLIDADGTGPGAPVATDDTYAAWNAGSLVMQNNTFIGCTVGEQVRVNGVNGSPADLTKFTTDGNTSLASLAGFSSVHNMNVTTNAVTVKHDILPGANISTSSLPPVDGFYTPAPYRGAFKVGEKSWLSECSYRALIGLEGNLQSCPADISQDGLIGTPDFLILLGSFNTSCQ
ncbi:MAG: hypothetical protein SH808_02720 [Saprospiraceae bacterium]|nr:hypothetical protein [Saprospiraceae bacterium]